MPRSLVYGVGINDADYVTKIQENSHIINGKQHRRVVWRCPFYDRWVNMLRRCYSKSFKTKNPTYGECYVCEEWLRFSNFKAWMETQDWEGKQLDKDILSGDGKVYSPNTCVFVSKALNLFVMESFTTLGQYPSGVYWNKKNGKFYAQCKDPLNRFSSYLGNFDTAIDAHITWIYKKLEYSVEVTNDERIKMALINRYSDKLAKAKASQDDLKSKAAELVEIDEIISELEE